MAFFKFRWPGQPSHAPKYPVEQAATDSQQERNAWHRMLGVVVLVTSLLTLMSWLLDTTPRGTVPQVTIELPNRNEVPPLPLPPVTVADGLEADEQIITDPPPSIAAAPTGVPPAFQELPDDDPEAAIQPLPLPVPVAPPLPVSPQEQIPVAVPPPPVTPPAGASTPNVQPAPPKPAPPKKPVNKPPAPVMTEADRAQALLDGKVIPAVPKTPVGPEARRAQALLENRPIASANVPKTGRFAVQAGVYFADKVQAVRDRLERAGFKTYVEDVRLKEGKIGLRVRIGPFATMTEAEKVEERIKSMGLEAKIFAL